MNFQPNSLAARDIASLLHPYTNLKTHQEDGPFVVTRGDGIYVYDDDGKPYIEAMAGLWCTALGFGNERLVETAASAMRDLPFYHGFNGKSHPAAIELAEKLLQISPVPMSKVFFANSGSEANDTAIKLVWYINNARGRPNKKKIISRQKAYHGVTVAAASLTGLPANQRDFDIPIDGILHTDCPHYYRYGEAGESEEDFASRCADNLEQLILAEGPDTVAAFFAEPVMGAGGVLVPPASYFEKIQAILKKYDILFIVDEVICGFGRTGNMFGTQTYNLAPDMISFAKALSSAYVPISALMVSEQVYQAMVIESEKIGIFGHGYTYGGHPVACAVALETLKIYEEWDIVSHVRSISPTLQNGLRALGEHPLVGEARGVGLIGALELVRDKSTREPFAANLGIGNHVRLAAEEAGVITRNMGDTIAFAPPLIIEDKQITTILKIVNDALDETFAMIEDKNLF
ncbi:MAG: aspartate aminotransferase family protein [Rhodospirillaceae bacterium]|jgi:4-aminobutyrate--pyruvate transaminase|nr:aspartate aminotransferase family protein [Rhodospirillaceae bacterium]MBT3885759.1 aspartate aminotransferase family protein [Rhodospirillaceae bacterium]MBT4672678.1 aspartate aminotransferase family protein [Rhodospirillaceae bacterium]MBT4718239.1 aspartate aminotransferase family protein [Rhodospirillaceae bacterium]MBT4748336.1 aspartate aminotransferase family protein [Rhodospirillaceae bacterium]